MYIYVDSTDKKNVLCVVLHVVRRMVSYDYICYCIRESGNGAGAQLGPGSLSLSLSERGMNDIVRLYKA